MLYVLPILLFWNCRANNMIFMYLNCKLKKKIVHNSVSKPRRRTFDIYLYFFLKGSWTFFLWNRKNVRKLFFKWLWKSISSQCKMSRNFPLKGSEMLSSSKKGKKSRGLKPACQSMTRKTIVRNFIHLELET